MAFDKDQAYRELRAMIEQHPDVAQMDTAAVLNWLTRSPWLAGLAGLHGLDLLAVVEANCCHAFEWGQQFKQTYGTPPTEFDWRASYYDRANDFAYRLSALQPFKSSGDAAEVRPRLVQEYGGPF